MKHISSLFLFLILCVTAFFQVAVAAPETALKPTASDAPKSAAPDVAQKRSPVSLQTTVKMRNETKYLVLLMERGHYLKTPVSELDVREFVREYMQNIDVFKLFFTSEDVQYFQDFFSPSVEIMLHQGTLLPHIRFTTDF